MADRDKKQKKKRAYLDDFEKDLNGNYQYRGAHYRYAGERPHGRALALLWLFCGGGAALTVAAGVLPGATARAPIYLLLPYMAALVSALYTVVLLVRFTRGGARLRAYIHEQTAQKLPSLCTLTAVLCGLAAVGQGVVVFLNGAQMLLGTHGMFILFGVLSCAAFAAAARLVKAMPWEREE